MDAKTLCIEVLEKVKAGEAIAVVVQMEAEKDFHSSTTIYNIEVREYGNIDNA